MLKHTFHARLSIWHLVLLVVILWLTHAAFAQQISRPASQITVTETEGHVEQHDIK